MRRSTIERVGKFAAENDLDLSAQVVEIYPVEIRRYEDPLERRVRKIVPLLERAIKRGLPWPEDLALVLVCQNGRGEFELLDGHHRLAAADRLDLEVVPALEISCKTQSALSTSPFVFTIWGLQEAMAEYDPLMKRNWELSVEGEKRKI